ncbi:ATPase [Bacteroidia bacterium]|nr:ATPase [Bacteroidia bacterium]
MLLIKRTLQDRIKDLIEPNKAILIFGPRHAGKFTLLKNLAGQIPGKTLLLNGDDYNVIAFFKNLNTSNFYQLLDGVNTLAITEAQNIPGIDLKIKLIVDVINDIKVIATASSYFDLLNRAGDPLEGKSLQFHLLPLSKEEIVLTGTDGKDSLESRLIYGSYPEIIALDSPEQKKDYLTNIAGTYLLKDILSIDGLKITSKLMELLRIIAFRLGEEISYNELGRQLKISKNTVEKYLTFLSKIFIIYRLNPFSGNLRKEVAKTGKWYFYDNGIRNALIGNFEPLENRLDREALLENYLIGERVKANYHEGLDKEFYFWRTYDNQQISLIEKSSATLLAIQIKWKKIKSTLPKAFKKAYPDTEYLAMNFLNI